MAFEKLPQERFPFHVVWFRQSRT